MPKRSKEISKKYSQEWRKKNPERAKELYRLSYKKRSIEINKRRRNRYATDSDRRYKHALQNKFTLYGITKEQYEHKLLEQEGVCAICKGGTGSVKRKTFVVDHNHQTKELRGLLCIRCNSGIGLLNENINTLEESIRYLKKYNAQNTRK